MTFDEIKDKKATKRAEAAEHERDKWKEATMQHMVACANLIDDLGGDVEAVREAVTCLRRSYGNLTSPESCYDLDDIAADMDDALTKLKT